MKHVPISNQCRIRLPGYFLSVDEYVLKMFDKSFGIPCYAMQIDKIFGIPLYITLA